MLTIHFTSFLRFYSAKETNCHKVAQLHPRSLRLTELLNGETGILDKLSAIKMMNIFLILLFKYNLDVEYSYFITEYVSDISSYEITTNIK